MPAEFSSSLPYILLAAGAGLLGGVISLFWGPEVTIRSAVQHFAAGAVLAAVAANVIPEVEQLGTLPGIVGGFVAGVLVMIALKWVVVRSEHKGKQRNKFPVGLAAAALAMVTVCFTPRTELTDQQPDRERSPVSAD